MPDLTTSPIVDAFMASTSAEEARNSISALSDRFNHSGKPIVFVADGDSLTAGFGVPAGSDWVTRIGAMPQLATATRYNYANSGDKISHVISQYPTQGRLVKPTSNQFGIYSLWIGANDVTAGDFNSSTWTANLDAFSATLRSDGWNILIIHKVTRIGGTNAAWEVNRENINAAIDAGFIAGQWDIRIENDVVYQTPFTKGWTDNTHFNADTYREIARYVNNAISSYRIGRVEPPPPPHTHWIQARPNVNGGAAGSVTVPANGHITINYALRGARIGMSSFCVLTRGDGAQLPNGVHISGTQITASNNMQVRYSNSTGGNLDITDGASVTITAFN